MNEETTAAKTDEVKVKKSKPTATKKAKAEKSGKRDRSMGDVPAKDRRRALVKYLRTARSFSAIDAKPIDVIAEKLGYNEYTTYCLVYHKFKLATDGLVKTAKIEGAQMGAYLTKKGQSVELDAIG